MTGDDDIAATLQVGPTSMGMVRILVCGESLELPMDFEPEEAEEIAEELRAAAERARKVPKGRPTPPGGGGSGGPGGRG